MQSNHSELDRIDEVLRIPDREVWIITSAADGDRGGLAATWVARASLDREIPLLLVAIAPNHFTAKLIQAGGAFAAHLLPTDQAPRVWNFALGSGRDRDKLASETFRWASSGCPVLFDCLAWLECRLVAQFDAGDRIFFWGQAVDGARELAGEALTERQLLESATPVQMEQLRAGLHQDIALLRQPGAAWRDKMALIPPSNSGS